MAIIITLVGLDSDYGFTIAGLVVGPDFVLIDVNLFFNIWWSLSDLNRGLTRYERVALTN